MLDQQHSLLAAAFFAVVLADARPEALLALVSLAVVLADACEGKGEKERKRERDVCRESLIHTHTQTHSLFLSLSLFFFSLFLSLSLSLSLSQRLRRDGQLPRGMFLADCRLCRGLLMLHLRLQRRARTQAIQE